TTSDGPAGRSHAAPSGSFATNCFAAVTHPLPGPKILTTLGILSVPYARAATACAPPTLTTASIPQSSAAASTPRCAVPPGWGGAQTIRSGQPARRAGPPSMMTEEGSEAVLPGT